MCGSKVLGTNSVFFRDFMCTEIYEHFKFIYCFYSGAGPPGRQATRRTKAAFNGVIFGYVSSGGLPSRRSGATIKVTVG